MNTSTRLRRSSVIDAILHDTGTATYTLRTPSSRFKLPAAWDHFGDINEMVFDRVAAVETGPLCFPQHLLEIAVVGVPEYLRELAAWPVLRPAGVGAPDTLKR
jgi:hypothetical protein